MKNNSKSAHTSATSTTLSPFISVSIYTFHYTTFLQKLQSFCKKLYFYTVLLYQYTTSVVHNLYSFNEIPGFFRGFHLYFRLSCTCWVISIIKRVPLFIQVSTPVFIASVILQTSHPDSTSDSVSGYISGRTLLSPYPTQ